MRGLNLANRRHGYPWCIIFSIAPVPDGASHDRQAALLPSRATISIAARPRASTVVDAVYTGGVTASPVALYNDITASRQRKHKPIGAAKSANR